MERTENGSFFSFFSLYGWFNYEIFLGRSEFAKSPGDAEETVKEQGLRWAQRTGRVKARGPGLRIRVLLTCISISRKNFCSGI
jgi:hypothetical protein